VTVDVLISHELADAVAAETCAAAFAREGWSSAVSATESTETITARTQLVIWSCESVVSTRLARENRSALDAGRLLQVLVQPREAPGRPAAHYGSNVVNAPDPYCFFQGLPIHPHGLDGSERSIDAFAHRWADTHRILVELARLGALPRPSDTWNARIVFTRLNVERAEPVVVSEHTSADDRLLRRDTVSSNSFVDSSYRTTIGNRWRMTLKSTGRLVSELVITEPEHRVDLPRRAPWWRRN
jgi:hypothetical protein